MRLFEIIKNAIKNIVGAFSGDPRYVQHFDWDPTKGGGGGFDPTPTQLLAINSGATEDKINQIATNTDDIADKLDKLTDTGEFVYSHDGPVQTSKGFEVADEPSGSAAHVTSSKTVKAVKTALDEAKYNKTGGQLDGTITAGNSVENIIKNSVNNRQLTIYGGTSWNSGSTLTLIGKDHSSRPGYFRLAAHDGSNNPVLEGRPDGTLQWNGKNVSLISSVEPVVNFTLNSGFTVDSLLVKQITEKVFYVKFHIITDNSLTANTETPFATGFTINGSSVNDTVLSACLKKDSSSVGCTWNGNRFFITPTVSLASTVTDKRVKVSGICVIN